LQELFDDLNRWRRKKVEQELGTLRRLPVRRLESCKRLEVRVTSGSTIRVGNNTYSVHSRLIGEQVKVKLYADHLQVWYAQRCIERLPRLRGQGKHRVDYRHIIDWLVRKPGAFQNYRYRGDLFPTSCFRMAYDQLKGRHVMRIAAKEYLKILYLAARENQIAVEQALRKILDSGEPITSAEVKQMVISCAGEPAARVEIKVEPADLRHYDALLAHREAV
jgi:hypothetical protein